MVFCQIGLSAATCRCFDFTLPVNISNFRAFFLFDSKVKKNLSLNEQDFHPWIQLENAITVFVRPAKWHLRSAFYFILHRREWGSHDLRSNLLLSYVVFQLSCFLWSRELRRERSRNGESIYKLQCGKGH